MNNHAIVIKSKDAHAFRAARNSMVEHREELIGHMQKYPLECEIVHEGKFYYRFVFENGAELDNAVVRIDAGLARLA